MCVSKEIPHRAGARLGIGCAARGQGGWLYYTRTDTEKIGLKQHKNIKLVVFFTNQGRVVAT